MFGVFFHSICVLRVRNFGSQKSDEMAPAVLSIKPYFRTKRNTVARLLRWLALVLALVVLINGCHPRPVALHPPFSLDTGRPMDPRRSEHEARLRLRSLPPPIPWGLIPTNLPPPHYPDGRPREP